jgi:hypothetical protein
MIGLKTGAEVQLFKAPTIVCKTVDEGQGRFQRRFHIVVRCGYAGAPGIKASGWMSFDAKSKKMPIED